MKKVLWVFILLLSIVLFSCDKINIDNNDDKEKDKDKTNEEQKEDKPINDVVDVDVNSSTLYVEKVENLRQDFIFGADISSIISLENAGIKFYDYEGNEDDIMHVLALSGINYIRVRIWNDPYDKDGNGYGGGNSDLAKAIAIGKRATANGLKLLVDFHYSDFWADPTKQMIPKAWKGLEYDSLLEDEEGMPYELYKYTKSSLQALKDEGVDVGMVQIGNETNGYMCGTRAWGYIANLMNAGSKAVREVLPDALVVLHFANPEKVERYPDYSSKLAYYNVDYDVFASSYYPYYHGTLENLAKVLSDVATNYGKKVMVAETSYANSDLDIDQSGGGVSGGVVKPYPFTIQGQANHIRNLTDTLVNKTTNAIGLFYWEPAWLAVNAETYEERVELWNKYGCGWTSAYSGEYDKVDAKGIAGGTSVENQAFFDKDGKPLESLKVYGLLREGNTSVKNDIDGLDDVQLICDINSPVVLPETVKAVMFDNSRVDVPVTWDVTEADYEKWSTRGVRKYTITGHTEGGLTAICYLSMIEYNYLSNWSFEDNKDGSPWELTQYGKCNEIYVEESAQDSLTGTRHFHFWSSETNSVDFRLEQEVKDLKSGDYKSSFAIMGNDGGDTDIYLYIKINDEIKYQTEKQPLTGWQKWNTGIIEKFSYTEGDKLVVGIYVKCSGSGQGAWAKIDDILLNSWTEPKELDTTIPVTFNIEKEVESGKAVYVVGSFNNWLPDENCILTKGEGNNWSGVVKLEEDEEIEYKFIVADIENPGTDPAVFEWEIDPNRTLTVSLDNDTINALWQGRNTGDSSQKYTVKFIVESNDATSMYLAGNFTNWFANKVEMTKDDSDKWVCEVEFNKGEELEFKFVKNGTAWEFDGGANRTLTVNSNQEFVAKWDSSSTSDETIKQKYQVTFKVTVENATKVLLAGNFTSWSTNAVEMTKGENDVWTATVEIEEGNISFKFVKDGTWEFEDVANSNRTLNVDSNKEYVATFNVANQ